MSCAVSSFIFHYIIFLSTFSATSQLSSGYVRGKVYCWRPSSYSSFLDTDYPSLFLVQLWLTQLHKTRVAAVSTEIVYTSTALCTPGLWQYRSTDCVYHSQLHTSSPVGAVVLYTCTVTLLEYWVYTCQNSLNTVKNGNILQGGERWAFC